MKRKIVMTLCAAACAGMLFGCSQKESTDSPKEADTDMEVESNTLVGQEGNETEQEEGTFSSGEEAVVKDARVDGYTLKEALAELENRNTLYAVKKGDLFYPIMIKNGPLPAGSLVLLGDDEVVQTVDFSSGDEIIVFTTGTISYQITPFAEGGYCVPISHQNDVLRVPNTDKWGSQVFVDGDEELQVDEYDGRLIEIDNGSLWILAGDKDEVLELKGLEGTVHKSAHYRCSVKYYIRENDGAADDVASDTASDTASGASEADSASYQLTDDGYAIIASSEVNPLDDGAYEIAYASGVFEVKSH